ncbi:hypothetical protein FJY93_04520 [Candidatus Kaiserbacteria bacterium]|nr:hypothetical protein [Candidatus Kaiserbacteria bacterium]
MEPSTGGQKRNLINFGIGIGIVVVVALTAGLYFSSQSMQKPVEASEPTPTQPQQVATSTYATTTFSLVYPADFTVNDAYAYDQFAKKPIAGVKFVIPTQMATGTNLSAHDTGISIEQLPRAKKCTADIYIPADVKAQALQEGGVAYSVATTSGAAAGNVYEEQVYALSGSQPCTAIRYFIHSTQIGNYPPGTVREFDRAALIEAFDTIRRSIVFVPPQQ